MNSSDNFPSYPSDNHHSSDDVYWRGGGIKIMWSCMQCVFVCINRPHTSVLGRLPQTDIYEDVKQYPMV